MLASKSRQSLLLLLAPHDFRCMRGVLAPGTSFSHSTTVSSCLKSSAAATPPDRTSLSPAARKRPQLVESTCSRPTGLRHGSFLCTVILHPVKGFGSLWSAVRVLSVSHPQPPFSGTRVTHGCVIIYAQCEIMTERQLVQVRLFAVSLQCQLWSGFVVSSLCVPSHTPSAALHWRESRSERAVAQHLSSTLTRSPQLLDVHVVLQWTARASTVFPCASRRGLNQTSPFRFVILITDLGLEQITFCCGPRAKSSCDTSVGLVNVCKAV